MTNVNIPSNMNTLTKRQYYLDVARVIAVVSITMNHAVSRSFQIYSGQLEEFNTLPFFLTIIKACSWIFSRVGVPIFLMISGALIMSKRIENTNDIKQFYRKNLLSLFIATEIWLAIGYWFNQILDNGLAYLNPSNLIPAVIGTIETMLFQNQIAFGSMWYMTMILCIYMTIPYVIIVKNKLSNDKFSPILLLPLIVIYCNSMIRPTINYLLQAAGLNSLTLTSDIEASYLFTYYYIYIFLGYWISKGGLSSLKNHYLSLLITFFSLLALIYQIYIYASPVNVNIRYAFPLIPIISALLFEII